MRHPLSWLLNTLYCLALAGTLPALFWSQLRKGKRREGWPAKLWGNVPVRAGQRPCVWLHAVSVGEVNLLAGLIRQLADARPDVEVWISTTTKTGYDLACKKYPEQTVFYCPLDFSWAVNRALRRVRPEVLVLAELELWPHLISLAKAAGVHVAVVNGRLSDRSFQGYSRLGFLVQPVLRQVDLVTAQDHQTAERFVTLGVRADRVHTTGSLKVDGLLTDRENLRTRQLRALAGFAPEDQIWLAGSTQEPEESIVLRVFRRLREDFPRLKLVFVPRHPERFDDVERLVLRSGLCCTRRNQIADEDDAELSEVLLVDTIGELGDWWGTAHVGFVGGSFGDRGGQNMLEPAALGVATCFGPNTRNFRDIVKKLLAAEAACEVADERELERFVCRALTDTVWTEQLTNRARCWVLNQQGATTETMRHLQLLLPAPAAGKAVA